jgi:hypothetical protein
MELKVGQALASTTDTTTVMVVRAPADDVTVTCGGAPMIAAKSAADVRRTDADSGHVGGTLLGKRYEDATARIELLCTKPGTSSLAVDGVPLTVKAAKPLPASD